MKLTMRVLGSQSSRDSDPKSSSRSLCLNFPCTYKTSTSSRQSHNVTNHTRDKSPVLQVFADQRYQRHDKRDKLPGWITAHLKDSHLNLSTDMLLHVAREFMRSMAQPYDRMQVGKSLLTEAQANSMDVSLL